MTVRLREKIAIGAELTLKERDAVLDALNFAQYLNLGQHAQTYPSRHPYGSHAYIDKAWDVLDQIKPGIIPNDVRAYLAGYFGAALEKAHAGGGR